MLLKRLNIVGFKSFADRTRLEFDRGVNVVVGPNGSGKSNILDAIAWVMGTQATRSLRTEKMEDVVFAGTATRPALSRAEVSLTFANDDGFLPLDLAEVTITRRLFRDGTSEYELNGVPCRLLDIQELISDGGVGRHQHVLVGQGQIGQILGARPEDHRAVIEEAAGITKHRSRRERASRRLDGTGADVDRLHDILGEKRRMLRPLKRQASAAARYDDVRSEARALQLWLGGERLRELRARLAAAIEEQQRLEESSRVAKEELAVVSADVDQLRADAGEAGAALERDASAAARLETVRERLRRVALVARERRLSLTSHREGAGQRRVDLAEELDDVTRKIAEEQAAVAELRTLSERRETRLTALEDEERSLAEQAQLPAEGVVANLRGELRSLEAARVRDEREEQAIEARRAVVLERSAEEGRERAELDGAIRTTDSDVTASQRAYDEAVDRRREAQKVWESDEESAAEHRLAVAAARARVDALEAALAGMGDPRSRDLVAGDDHVVGTLAARLDVPADIAPAVDAALGTWRDAYVTESRGPIRDIVAGLKSEGLGGVSLIGPIGDVVLPAAASLGLPRLVDRLGSDADRALAEALLGDVVLVEGWSEAWRLVESHPELRAVTPEGDVVGRAGMIVAQPDGAGPAALEAARVELEICERELARSESHRLGTRRTFEHARSAERDALEALEELEAKLAGHTEALGFIERALAEGENELARLDARLESIAEARVGRDERIADLQGRVAEFEGEEAARQAAWEAIQRRREDVARRRDEARRLREETAAALGASTERLRMLERRAEVVRADLGQLELLPEADDRIERLAAIEAGAAATSEVVASHIDVLRERQRVLREQAGVAGTRLAEAETRREQLVAETTSARDRLGVLSVEVAEVRVREESASEALRRDADASEETALAAERPELPEGVEPRQRLESLLAELRRMGPVNPLAAAEYSELSGEVELLEAQLADLEASRTELRKVIKALDEEMAGLFVKAFGEISDLYREHFSMVFPGGSGRLRLVDPDDPLSSGVEVEAQPYGKKVGRLSLLSGGERSLAALAFLFAVFRARPSPFYVLDEVEAALDDANLHRFLHLVDTLRSSAQLVIITHQQQTMEAADILYGITMEPGESTKVIAKRMSRALA